MMGAAAFMVLTLAAPPPQEPGPAATGSDAARHLIFLAENRPVFLCLRVMSRDRPFEASWIDSVRALHTSLDRNGDGTVTTKEADEKVFLALVRLAAGATVPSPRVELDVQPKDGKVSIDELAEALRPILGPFRLQIGRQAIGRTDALFDQLDRDKDGVLTRPELAAIAGSLRPLDLDDNEMISADELEPFNSPAYTALMEESSERRARFTALPPVAEIVAGESSLRTARLLLKKYDKAKGDRPGRPDNKLSPTEFAIDPDAFARADANGDDALDTEELRELLARTPTDLTLDVELSPEASGRASVRSGAGGTLPRGAQVRQLADGDVEFAIGQVRLDIHVEQGNTAAEEARRILTQRFKAADVNKDGYLEGKERATIDAPQSPLTGLSELIDRDGDGKVYLKELLEFAERQAAAARCRLVVTTSDQGRAIFGILDLDRDRRLGAREVMRTVDRVMSWDGDGDGRVSPDEIPYHFRVTIARSGLPGLTGEVVAAPAARSMVAIQSNGASAGPDWFQKMDRNHDGDVSRREFLGTRDQFDRLDRDKDGLIDADEARAALAAKTKDAPRDRSRP
jgi:Ca2+-binding EF-hand superfamily protein